MDHRNQLQPMLILNTVEYTASNVGCQALFWLKLIYFHGLARLTKAYKWISLPIYIDHTISKPLEMKAFFNEFPKRETKYEGVGSYIWGGFSYSS